MSVRTAFRFFCLVVIAMVVAGCFSARKADIAAFTRPEQAHVTTDSYILEPPDSITVIASKVPELQGTTGSLGQTQVIRPDGVVSFEGIGEISVAGKTPRHVAEIIAAEVSKLYKLTGNNPVDIRVNNQSKFYYIIGQINQPGGKIFTGRETTLSAIAKAVPNNRAWKEMVQVIRPSRSPQERSKIISVNFKQMVEHGDMSKNLLLEEGDVIYVPATVLASIGLTVEELVGPIIQGSSGIRALTPAAGG